MIFFVLYLHVFTFAGTPTCTLLRRLFFEKLFASYSICTAESISGLLSSEKNCPILLIIKGKLIWLEKYF